MQKDLLSEYRDIYKHENFNSKLSTRQTSTHLKFSRKPITSFEGRRPIEIVSLIKELCPREIFCWVISVLGKKYLIGCCCNFSCIATHTDSLIVCTGHKSVHFSIMNLKWSVSLDGLFIKKGALLTSKSNRT